jgi:hypothetical protein
MPTLSDFENAIAQEEGYYVEGSLPNTLNNPGDLTDGNGNLINFPTTMDGWNALTQKLTNVQQGASKVYSPSQTLEQFENTYTGGDPNAASNIASILGGGVTPSTPVGDLLVGGGPTSTPAATTSPSTQGNSSTSSASSILSSIFPGFSVVEYLPSIVAVLAGLVLLAGAVFGFDKVQDTVTSTVKKGAEAGGIAAL